MDKETGFVEATLCYPARENELLLGIKTRKIGKGRWNGYGGDIHDGESPEAAAVRELEEEAGLRASPGDLEKIAVVDFFNIGFTCRVHVYLLHKWQDEPLASPEMATPTWFAKFQLPLERMMPADRVWLPIALTRKIYATASYGPDQQELLGEVKIYNLSEMPAHQHRRQKLN